MHSTPSDSDSLSRAVIEAATAPFIRTRVPRHARWLFALLDRLVIGSLELTMPDGATRVFGPGGAPAHGASVMPARLAFHDWDVAAEVLKGGDVTFGETYMEGRWTTPDLTQVLTLIAANQTALERLFYGRFWTRWLMRLNHLLRANTRRGAKRNIVAHYDLGNDFYRLWLDPTMSYSAALFDGDYSLSTEAAQKAKYERILGELDVSAASRVLEIGCGWGGFVECAAQAGCEVTGISLSDAQTRYAQQRIEAAGLSRRVALRIQDYREIAGAFDAIASIEMVEAVGERWWLTYFQTLARTLAIGGRACLQAITIKDERFERYRTQSDFIQQYIFPGGMLPSRSRLIEVARDAGFELVRGHAFGRDYLETVKRWLAAFDAHGADVRALGFDETFIRGWRFYLALCAAGFDTETTDVAQYTFVRDR